MCNSYEKNQVSFRQSSGISIALKFTEIACKSFIRLVYNNSKIIGISAFILIVAFVQPNSLCGSDLSQDEVSSQTNSKKRLQPNPPTKKSPPNKKQKIITETESGIKQPKISNFFSKKSQFPNQPQLSNNKQVSLNEEKEIDDDQVSVSSLFQPPLKQSNQNKISNFKNNNNLNNQLSKLPLVRNSSSDESEDEGEKSPKVENHENEHQEKQLDVPEEAEEESQDILSNNGKDKPKKSLNIALLKKDIKSFDEAIKKPKHPVILDSYKIFAQDDETHRGLVVFKKQPPKKLDWVISLENYLLDVLPQVPIQGKGSSLPIDSSLVFIETDSGKFVFIFGDGRYLLKKGVKDPHFGLRVALNNIEKDDHEAIKSFAISIPGINPIHINTRYGRGIGAKDIMLGHTRALTKIDGRNKKKGTRIGATGACAVVSYPIEVEDFPKICDQLLKLSQKSTYKELFPWVDELSPVEETDKIENLDRSIIKILQDTQNLKWFLSEPYLDLEYLEKMEETLYYTHSLRRKEEKATLEEISNLIKNSKLLSIPKLKKTYKIHAYNSNDKPIHKWSIYNALVLENVFEEQLYILQSGKWYEVGKDFGKTLNNEIDELFVKEDQPTLPPVLAEELPDKKSRNTKNYTEGLYNKRVAKDSKGELLLMDTRTVKGNSSKTAAKKGKERSEHGIEVCDLLTKDKHLIHVKDWKSSANFSHLYAQGLVSAESIKSSNFRKRAKDKYVRFELLDYLRDLQKQNGSADSKLERLRKELNKLSKNLSFKETDRDEKIRKQFISLLRKGKFIQLDDVMLQTLTKKIEQDQEVFTSILNPLSFDPKEYTVAYAFFHQDDRDKLSDYLPFFSRVSLKAAVQKLHEQGYKVIVKRIIKPRSEAPSSSASSNNSSSGVSNSVTGQSQSYSSSFQSSSYTSTQVLTQNNTNISNVSILSTSQIEDEQDS